jgi:hypothetical protein
MSLQNVVKEFNDRNTTLNQQKKQIFALFCKIWLHNVLDDLKPQAAEVLANGQFMVQLQLGERAGGVSGTLQEAALFFGKDNQSKTFPLKISGGVPIVPDVYALGEFLVSVQNW